MDRAWRAGHCCRPAAATSRIRLGTLVTGMTHRNPSVLAAEVVTVDHVSGGRVECAIGAAWNVDEHTELGIPFPPAGERMDRLEEGVQVLRLLMSGDRVSFAGLHYRLEGARYRPEPGQRTPRSGSAAPAARGSSRSRVATPTCGTGGRTRQRSSPR